MTGPEKKEIAFTRRRIIVLAVAVILVVLAGLAMITVSRVGELPASAFVSYPQTPLSTVGSKVVFGPVSAIHQKGLAVGVNDSLLTSSGAPVPGATVYVTYYYRAAYRTQSASTQANGYFEVYFPMNWTGYLRVTLTYLGDGDHQGLKQEYDVAGEQL